MSVVMAQRIESKVRAGLDVARLELDNESYMHNVAPGSESHFRLVVVSDDFEGQMLVRRHQQLYGLLADELAGGVHALALHTFTQQEWAARGGSVDASPACRGGSAK